MRDRIQLSSAWAARIVICTNHETVLEGRDLICAACNKDEIVGDATEAASDAIFDALSGNAETDSFFHNWHGGKYSYDRVAYHVGHVVADVYARLVVEEADLANDEEATYTDWEWTDDPLPVELGDKLREALEAADEAHTAELDRWEASERESNAQFANYQAEHDA